MRTQDMMSVLNALTEVKHISEDVSIYVTTEYMKDNNNLLDKLLNEPFQIENHYYDLFDTFCTTLAERLDYMFLKNNVWEIDENDLQEAYDELLGELEGDIYTYELTTWLNSHSSHVEYLGDAVKELESKSGFDILMGANYLWKSELYSHFFDIAQYILEYEVIPPSDHYDYEFAGTLENFQDSKYTLLQIDYDIEALRQHFKIDDEFDYYLVAVENGEYLEVYGLSGINLTDSVHRYIFKSPQ